MKKYLIVLMLFYSTIANAQTTFNPKEDSPYSVNFTFTPQLFLNQNNIKNDGIAPDPISTKNTGGYRFGLEIERKSQYNGFVIGFGATYSRQHQYINIHIDNLSFYDPSIADELNKLGSFNYNYATTSFYMDFHLTAGYILSVNRIMKGWNFVSKAGISLRKYWDALGDSPSIGISLERNDTIYLDIVNRIHVRLGGGGGSYQWEMEGYAGLMKDINLKFLKNISLGIEVGRAMPLGDDASATGEAKVLSVRFDRTENNPFSVDKYKAKDWAIGLKLSAGLWYK